MTKKKADIGFLISDIQDDTLGINKEYYDRIDEAASKVGITVYTDAAKTRVKPIGIFLKEIAKKWDELK